MFHLSGDPEYSVLVWSRLWGKPRTSLSILIQNFTSSQIIWVLRAAPQDGKMGRMPKFRIGPLTELTRVLTEPYSNLHSVRKSIGVCRVAEVGD